MSVFKKLKGTFQNAQNEFKDGIRALTSVESPSRKDPHNSLQARDINLNVGADLLHHYQNNWSVIQAETRESAKKAEEVSTRLTPLFLIWERHAESIHHLEEELKTVPTIFTMLTQLHKVLNDLSTNFQTIEKDLDFLDNICEEQIQQKRMVEEKKRLGMYKAKKEMEADRAKVELALSHAKKMAELESAKKKSLKERAEVFTSAFQNDLEFYKTHGHPGRIPVEFPKVSSLSEIELEEDKETLDSFLGPQGEADASPESQELSAEGVYIEDDYTADFSVKPDMDFQEENGYSSAEVIRQLEVEERVDENENGEKTSHPETYPVRSPDLKIPVGSVESGEDEMRNLDSSQEVQSAETLVLKNEKETNNTPDDSSSASLVSNIIVT